MATRVDECAINSLRKPLITLATKLKILTKCNQKQLCMYYKEHSCTTDQDMVNISLKFTIVYIFLIHLPQYLLDAHNSNSGTVTVQMST